MPSPAVKVVSRIRFASDLQIEEWVSGTVRVCPDSVLDRPLQGTLYPWRPIIRRESSATA